MLSPEWIIGGVLIALLILLVSNKIDASLLFVGVVLVFFFTGLISINEVLNSFANETLVALMVLLQVTAVVERSAFIPWISGRIFIPGKQGASIVRLTLVTAIISAFLNNTAVVAGLLGVTRHNPAGPPSKFLIPLSYAAIAGGVLTLIGTSTNLVVNGLAISAGLDPISFWDFTPIGLGVCLLVIPYMAFILPKLLPDRREKDNGEERAFFVEAIIQEGSQLNGNSVEKNGLRHLQNLYLAEIVRQDKLISPVTPDEVLQAGDTLVFTGEVTNLLDLQGFHGLAFRDHPEPLLKSNLREVVVKHSAPIVGMSIRDARFRTRFDAAVVAVRRGNERISGKLGDVMILPGDHLVLAGGMELSRHHNIERNFIQLEKDPLSESLNMRKSWIALLLFLSGLVCYVAGWASLLIAMTSVLLAYLGLGLAQINQLKHRLPVDLFLMIGSALAMAKVLEKHGVATDLGNALVNSLGIWGPYGALIGVFVATLIVTELITNNAAAALIFPIAVSAAHLVGADPKPFILALAFAASGSFLTPIGYQTNMMVYSAGSYRFVDFFKGGIGITLLYAVAVLTLLPIFFPFFPAK